mmetsp:Transcript_38665/g.83772  ORF Transcript_38665/g.83772 Transcript_38665/m.83772 type:complete len:222 (+) Transcript_38665:73-738(+)
MTQTTTQALVRWWRSISSEVATSCWSSSPAPSLAKARVGPRFPSPPSPTRHCRLRRRPTGHRGRRGDRRRQLRDRRDRHREAHRRNPPATLADGNRHPTHERETSHRLAARGVGEGLTQPPPPTPRGGQHRVATDALPQPSSSSSNPHHNHSHNHRASHRPRRGRCLPKWNPVPCNLGIRDTGSPTNASVAAQSTAALSANRTPLFSPPASRSTTPCLSVT